MTTSDKPSKIWSRRKLLKTAGTVAGVAVAAPWVMRGALGSSGELKFLGWAGYDEFPNVFKAFEAKTGIKVRFTGLGSQDEMVAQAKTGAATNGAFDISEPTVDRLDSWLDNDFVQPWNEAKVNLGGVEPAFLQGTALTQATRSGKRYCVTSVWGTEALTFNTKEAPLEYGKAKLADLLDDRFAGRLTVRTSSFLGTTARALEVAGQLPHSYYDSFKDEAKMVANYDAVLKVLLPKRKNIGQFWSNENEAQGAFRTNGCVIGHCWDTTAGALMKEGLPIGYISPMEGAAAWLQSFVLFKGAKNVEQAHAWASWINSAEGGAAWARAFSANSTSKGAIELTSEQQKKFFKMAYPGDALSKLWWYPAQPSWFVTKRTEYAKKLQSA